MEKEETLSIIRSILNSTKSSYTVSMLCKDFKKSTGIDIPLYGFKNVSDFLQSIPNTVKVTGLYPVQQVHLVNDEKTAHITSLVSKQRNPSKKVINKRKRNVNRHINSTNPVEKRTFHTVEYLDSKPPSLETPEKYKNIENTNDVRDIDHKLQKLKLQPDVSLHCYSSQSNESTLSRHIFPLDDKIPSIDLYFLTKVGEYIEVCPSEISNPNKFYLHLRRYKKKLTDLSNKLQVFYLNEEKQYRIPQEEIQQRQTCVVSMCNTWHRAEIVKVIDSSLVSVLLVDYGIKIKTLKSNLRYLHRFFASFPKQAILASLANIEPEDASGWSQEATERFFQLAYQKDLVAGVVKIDFEIPWLSVALSSTDEFEVHINDTLVEEGLARFEIYDSFDKSLSPIFHREPEFRGNSNYYVSKNISSRNYFYSSSCSSCSISPTFYKPSSDKHRKKSSCVSSY